MTTVFSSHMASDVAEIASENKLSPVNQADGHVKSLCQYLFCQQIYIFPGLVLLMPYSAAAHFTMCDHVKCLIHNWKW